MIPPDIHREVVFGLWPGAASSQKSLEGECEGECEGLDEEEAERKNGG